jgi:hypothetical protein
VCERQYTEIRYRLLLVFKKQNSSIEEELQDRGALVGIIDAATM